jgi:hypothetical protein
MHLHGWPKQLSSFIDHSCSLKHRCYVLFIVISLIFSALYLSIHSIIFQAAKGLLPSSKTSTGSIKDDFLTYSNSAFGVRMQYPINWSVQEIGNVSGANNTIAIFKSPSKTSSQLGNISGVSGNFVPYLDIFVFDSKNMSLDQIIKGRLNYFHNNSDFVLNQSNPITLKTYQSAYLLNYSVTIGGDEHFKKIQVFAPVGNKVYVVTFTSQQETFSNYMPLVQKMINSFGVFHDRMPTTVQSPSPLSLPSKQMAPTPKKAPTGQTSHPNIPLIPAQ